MACRGDVGRRLDRVRLGGRPRKMGCGVQLFGSRKACPELVEGTQRRGEGVPAAKPPSRPEASPRGTVAGEQYANPTSPWRLRVFAREKLATRPAAPRTCLPLRRRGSQGLAAFLPSPEQAGTRVKPGVTMGIGYGVTGISEAQRPRPDSSFAFRLRQVGFEPDSANPRSTAQSCTLRALISCSASSRSRKG